MIRILITGHGDHSDPEFVKHVLNYYMSNITDKSLSNYVFVHGGCPSRNINGESVDMIAHWYAKLNGIGIDCFPPNVEGDGDDAFRIRNQAMVNSGINFCLAFPDGESPGTWQTVEMARKAKIHTRVFERPELTDDLITG